MITPAAVPVAPVAPKPGSDRSRRPVRKPRRVTIRRRDQKQRPRPAVVHARPQFAGIIVEDPNIGHVVFSFSAYREYTGAAS